nr:PRD domain-containing protein [uncultured Acetatifactor sp.]
MVIEKVINNNVISSRDADNNEIIVMGRGIGFQKKPGQAVNERHVEKVFRLENSDVREQFKNLLESMPLEYIQVSADIISYAKKKLNTKLSQNVYLTLTDHIAFAIERFKKDMPFSNALYGEIKRFYPEEFRIGIHALRLIEECAGIRLPDDEAASIAIHLVDAEFDIKVRDTYCMTNMMEDIVRILEKELVLPPEESFHRDFLLSSLKFLSHRLLFIPLKEGTRDQRLYEFVRKHCCQEYEPVQKIKKFIREKYGCDMTEEEQIYLTLWLKQAVDGENNSNRKGRTEHGGI